MAEVETRGEEVGMGEGGAMMRVVMVREAMMREAAGRRFHRFRHHQAARER